VGIEIVLRQHNRLSVGLGRVQDPIEVGSPLGVDSAADEGFSGEEGTGAMFVVGIEPV
jgi:hypothetical protein